jgi:hypothetical protein
MYGGLFGYLLVPTVPPWMAFESYRMLPPVHRVLNDVYNTSFPVLRSAFDVNPIAAMPSLHTAFPVFLTAVAIRQYRLRGLLFIPYALTVIFSLLFCGEHYLLDVLVGATLALIVYVFVYHTAIPSRIGGRIEAEKGALTGGIFKYLNTELKRKLALTVAIVALAEGMGQIVMAENLPNLNPSKDFIEGQMMGRSERANYFLGVLAYSEGNYQEAQRKLQISLKELQEEETITRARGLLAYSAYRNEDFKTVIRTLSNAPWEALSKDDVFEWSTACFSLKRLDEGFAVLDRLEREYPCDPEIQFRRAYEKHRGGLIDPVELKNEILSLERRKDAPRAKGFAALLRSLPTTEGSSAKTKPVADAGLLAP